jgi:hypothetical protein
MNSEFLRSPDGEKETRVLLPSPFGRSVGDEGVGANLFSYLG